jgi:hypothetical protein
MIISCLQSKHITGITYLTSKFNSVGALTRLFFSLLYLFEKHNVFILFFDFVKLKGISLLFYQRYQL